MSVVTPLIAEVKATHHLIAARYTPEKQFSIPSLAEFVTLAWRVIEPATPFTSGYHIDAICKHLEAVSAGSIKRLLVNMPPRHGKSTIISVLWPIWSWLRDPSHRWLCASYALSLAIRDNRKCRLLIQSPWFQESFPGRIILSSDQNVKIKFENTRSGYRQAVSVGSSATGEGGDTLLIDDPHSIEDKTSDIKRMTALEWFRDTWSTRLNDQRTGAMVVVGQRIHSEDLSGTILKGEAGEQWVHLNLPSEYEPESRCVTAIWQDWRKDEGELLWKERFPQEVIERAKRKHGAMAYAALYQQQPIPSGGGQFKREWFRYFQETDSAYLLSTSHGTRSVLKYSCSEFGTVDLAISSKQTADYTVFAIWAVTPERDLLLIKLIRARLSNPEQLKTLRVLRAQHPHAYFKIEKVGYQLALIQQALAEGIPCTEYQPVRDKVSRASTPAIWMENEKLFWREGAEYLPDVETELLQFPKGPHDDIVDNHSMAAEEVTIGQGVEELDEETASAISRYVGY